MQFIYFFISIFLISKIVFCDRIDSNSITENLGIIYNEKFKIMILCLVISAKLKVDRDFSLKFQKREVMSQNSTMSWSYKTTVQLISNYTDKDFVHDLGKATPTQAGNNTIRQLSVSQFPALAQMGISYSLFELAPCGINLPHIHPRAAELLYVKYLKVLSLLIDI